MARPTAVLLSGNRHAGNPGLCNTQPFTQGADATAPGGVVQEASAAHEADLPHAEAITEGQSPDSKAAHWLQREDRQEEAL